MTKAFVFGDDEQLVIDGTGFTARRAMGFGPIKLQAMETYMARVYGLLRGEIVDFQFAFGPDSSSS